MRARVSSRFLEGLLYALLAFGLFAFGGVEPWSRSALEILSFLLALACFLRGGPEARASRLWLFAAGLALLAAAQRLTVAAPDGPRPWLPFTAAPRATQQAAVLWTAYAALLWSVPQVIRTHEAARRFARVVFAFGAVLAALGLLQAATGSGRLYWLRDAAGLHPFGPYYNRDHAASVLVMSLAVGVGLFFSVAARGGGETTRARSLIAAGAALLLGGIVACGSRAAALAMPLAAAALGLLGADFASSARERRLRAAAALAAAAVVLLLAFRAASESADAGALVDRSVMGRLSIYGDAERWWRDAPLFGTGLGSFETVYPAYQDVELRASVAHAHSDWLELLLEAGLLGALAAVVAAACGAAAAVRAWRGARSREMRALIGGGLGAAAAFSIHALFEFCFQTPGDAFLFLALVGFLISAPAWADKAAADGPPSRPSAAPALLAGAGFLFLAQAALRPAAAARLAAAAGTPAERAESLARAYAWDPDPAYLRRLAALCDERASADGGLAARRAALGYALAAAERSPFDAQALSLAGASLARLGRAADGRALMDEAREVWFAPLSRGGADPLAEAEAARRRLEDLRALARSPVKR
jgi:O-antigen ligase